jgi:hypothetical protein
MERSYWTVVARARKRTRKRWYSYSGYVHVYEHVYVVLPPVLGEARHDLLVV